MDRIYVETKDKKYPIYFEKNLGALKDAVRETGLEGRKLCIITDSNVGDIYADKFIESIKDCFNDICVYTFKAGENSKNLDTISDFYDFFMNNHVDRKTVVAGLGGGVCGDMAGFAASTYLRGIKFIQIPTSLLSQVDSSVGGKVGVDFKISKNLIGSFYQPDFVYINLETLDTLPKREFSAGMAEVIKYGPITSREFFDYISANKEKISSLNKECLKEVIKMCCEIKADVVSKDERESGLREILNFGHTIGHAVESKMNFKLLHGECVALGMAAVMDICLKRGYVTQNDCYDLKNLLEFFGLKLSINGVSVEEIYSQMFLDKKVKNNKIGFVLINGFGKPFSTTDVSKDEILSAVNSILR